MAETAAPAKQRVYHPRQAAKREAARTDPLLRYDVPGRRMERRETPPLTNKVAFKTRTTWMPAFFEGLAEFANVTQACRRAGISMPTYYNMRRTKPQFAAKCDEIINESLDQLDFELWQRALNPLYPDSTKCLLTLHKLYRRELYDRSGQLPGQPLVRVETNVEDGGTANVQINVTPIDYRVAAASLAPEGYVDLTDDEFTDAADLPIMQQLLAET